MELTIDDITALSAQQLSAAIRARTLSCREVMQAYLARIHRLNPRLNAIVNLAPTTSCCNKPTRATPNSRAADQNSRGWLHGMPQAIKDTGHAIGFPTTYGSPLQKDAMATQDSLMTARMKAAGCIVIGKTNMPEFGLGSHTFNTLFGATRNAWDASVSAGGSSGGAAVALAQRLLPVADGSDFMGSLRNPAAWNNVFGLRPSQGRVPFWPASRRVGHAARHRRADGAQRCRPGATAGDSGGTRCARAAVDRLGLRAAGARRLDGGAEGPAHRLARRPRRPPRARARHRGAVRTGAAALRGRRGAGRSADEAGLRCECGLAGLAGLAPRAGGAAHRAAAATRCGGARTHQARGAVGARPGARHRA